MIRIVVDRFYDNGEATIGIMMTDGKFEAFTLEDEKRTKKVNGETRIPAGLYSIDFQKIVTPKTKAYRRKYDWFSFHLEIKDVSGFTNVYLHVGNYDTDTDGCVLLGTTADSDSGVIGRSTKAFKRFYEKISSGLERGDEVSIRILN